MGRTRLSVGRVTAITATTARRRSPPIAAKDGAPVLDVQRPELSPAGVFGLECRVGRIAVVAVEPNGLGLLDARDVVGAGRHVDDAIGERVVPEQGGKRALH